MRKMRLILIAGVALAAALAIAFAVWHEGHPAEANPFLMVGIDMDPTGNSCPGTGTDDCTLGTIDQCVSVSSAAGTTFTIDTFIRGLTNGFQAWNQNLNFPDIYSPANLSVTSITSTDPLVNLSVQSTGSTPAPANPDLPGTASSFNPGVAELGTSETTPPFTQGVLGRITFTVGAGATSGVYDLTLDPPPLSAYLDKDSEAYVVDAIVNAKVALGQECPPSPPLPTATPGASPTPSTVTPTPTPAPTGTPTPGAVPLAAGWNDVCYQGQAQDIDDAFAPVAANVQAVYRLNQQEGFDRWFPNGTANTIDTLSPFDQLFILTSSDATWTVQPLADPPSSTPLNAGWNSVCYLGTGADVAQAAAGISGAFSVMYSLPPGQGWLRYIPGQPPGTSTLSRLERFTSVLILMTEPGAWAFTP